MSFLGKSKQFGKWLVSPYIFSKRDMNPFKGISQPLNIEDEDKQSTTDGMDSDEKELNRQKGIVILNRRRLVTACGLALWVALVFGGLGNSWFPFPFKGMVTFLKYLYLFVFVSMFLMLDYQLVTLQKNVKTSFLQYLRYRLGK